MCTTGQDVSVLHNVAHRGKRATEAPEFVRGERHGERSKTLMVMRRGGLDSPLLLTS